MGFISETVLENIAQKHKVLYDREIQEKLWNYSEELIKLF